MVPMNGSTNCNGELSAATSAGARAITKRLNCVKYEIGAIRRDKRLALGHETTRRASWPVVNVKPSSLDIGGLMAILLSVGENASCSLSKFAYSRAVTRSSSQPVPTALVLAGTLPWNLVRGEDVVRTTGQFTKYLVGSVVDLCPGGDRQTADYSAHKMLPHDTS